MKKTYKAFSAGELSEDMFGRYDVDKYGTGCRALKNNIIMPQGGVFFRPGTKMTCAAGDSTKAVCLIPFEFSTIQAYVLEFGHLYMRVIKDGAQVLEANKVITAISQANPGVVTSNAHGFSNGQEVYIASILGMTDLNGRNFTVAGVTANTFTLIDMFGNAVNTTAMSAYISGGTAGRVYEIATPYTESELFDLYFAQTADVMTFAHEAHDVMELTRTGHTAWTITTALFKPSITWPVPISVAASPSSGATVNKYKVTAVKDETYEESLVGTEATKAITGATQANPCVLTIVGHGYTTGDEVYLDAVGGMTQLNGRYVKVTSTGANTVSLQGVDSSAYTAYTSGGTAARTHTQVANDLTTAGNKNTISWTAVTGAIKYNIYKSESGTFGYIGSSEALSFVDDNIEPAVGNTPPRARNPFEGTGNKPSVVTFQNQRRVFAATLNKPDTLWFSRAGQYGNFSTSVPNKDDDAITFALASGQVNKINHLVSFRDLLAMTVSQEYKVGANGGPYTPTTMQAFPETNYGSQGGGDIPSVRPILIGNTAIISSKYGSSVRDYGFTFEADGYDGNDLSVLSKHLLKDRYIKQWAFAQEPDRIIWAVMSDGKLCSLTYMREHRVWGWARHETDGFVESICVIPDIARRMDSVYMVVRRTINEQEIRYIERLEKYIDAPVAQSYFLDCGLSYDGAAITVVKNLWHLEGKTVKVLADGDVLPDKVVTNGQITLAKAASIIHVGLGYQGILWPMPTDMDTKSGSTKGDPKRLTTCYVETIRTRGIECGQTDTDTAYAKIQPATDNLDLDSTIEPFTGMQELSVESAWDATYVSPVIFQNQPLPAKILSLTPNYA